MVQVVPRSIEAIREFNAAFSPPNDPDFWAGLIREEVDELKEAVLNVFKEAVDVRYTIAGYAEAGGAKADLKPFVEELVPYFELLERGLYDDAELMSVAFELVHASNMSKLGDDGKPVRREDGKVLKGPNYIPPDLSALLKV